MNFVNFFIKIKARLTSHLPVSKKEFYADLMLTAELVKAVKEIEAINRTQIMSLIYKVEKIEQASGNGEVEKPDKHIDREGMYIWVI